MILDRILVDMADADATNQPHRSTLLKFLLACIAGRATGNGRSEPTEQDVQAGVIQALSAVETQEDRMELANRLGAAEISGQDVLFLAGYVDAKA